MRKQIFVVATAAVLAVLATSVLLAQSDPFIGTWKLNATQSKYGAGPAPQNRTMTIDAQGDSLKYSSEGTSAAGTHFAWSFTANYPPDGKDNPILGTGVPNGADTIALKRINTNTTESTFKKAGRVVLSVRSVVSKDGKIMTNTGKETNAKGQPAKSVIVWDKQ